MPLPLLAFPDGRTGQASNAESAKLKTEPRAPCGKCRVQHDRNMNAVINIRFTTHCKESQAAPRQGADAP